MYIFSSLNNQEKIAEKEESSEHIDKQVADILKDPELHALLMDTKTQQMVLECADPAKFAMHMRDPETRVKIRKLQRAGLVQTDSSF